MRICKLETCNQELKKTQKQFCCVEHKQKYLKAHNIGWGNGESFRQMFKYK